VLRVKNLQVYYGMIHALRAASIHVREKEIVALLGGNGSGKTTLLSAISGVVRAASGAVVPGHHAGARRLDRAPGAGPRA
jgi:branched-chain amino acid transport system ATP-binding protein